MPYVYAANILSVTNSIKINSLKLFTGKCKIFLQSIGNGNRSN
jgi:hypothetical protein